MPTYVYAYNSLNTYTTLQFTFTNIQYTYMTMVN
jgi:hypothetical protein